MAVVIREIFINAAMDEGLARSISQENSRIPCGLSRYLASQNLTYKALHGRRTGTQWPNNE
jgi:hypothetical protein